jgi:hypothetical protein
MEISDMTDSEFWGDANEDIALTMERRIQSEAELIAAHVERENEFQASVVERYLADERALELMVENGAGRLIRSL